jgi:hypothetical protein
MPDERYWRIDSLGEGRVNIYKSLFKPVFPLASINSLALDHDPDDADGRINVGETGYKRAEYTFDSDWQASGSLTLSVFPDDTDIILTRGEITLPVTPAGGTVNNFSLPLTFTPGSSFIDGRRVVFHVTLRSSTGYFKTDTISAMIGYPAILVYDSDGGLTYN